MYKGISAVAKGLFANLSSSLWQTRIKKNTIYLYRSSPVINATELTMINDCVKPLTDVCKLKMV